MSRSYLKESEEERGKVPGCTGALLEIVDIEKTKTSERAKTPGLRKYTIQLKVVEPANIAGMRVFDHRCVVGTPEDPLAQNRDTWKRQEGGAARLKRLLVRSGTPITDDDTEWMEAAEGQQVVSPLIEDEEFPTAPGLYYRPGDEDAPVIGLADGDARKTGGRRKAKGPAAAAQQARAARTRVQETPEEDEPEPVDEPEEEDEDEGRPKAKKGEKAAAPVSKTKKRRPEPDDEEEDDEDDED